MSNALQNAMHPLQFGEELIAAGVDELFRRWQASTDALGKLCTGAERWQAAFRQMQAPVNVAEILRARAILWIAGYPARPGAVGFSATVPNPPASAPTGALPARR
jgi:hypothetical protein